MPSSMNSKSFQAASPRCGTPSFSPILVSMSLMHVGPRALIPSRSSVDNQSLFPPLASKPSSKPSRLSRTVAALLSFTQELAIISEVAQSGKI